MPKSKGAVCNQKLNLIYLYSLKDKKGRGSNRKKEKEKNRKKGKGSEGMGRKGKESICTSKQLNLQKQFRRKD